MEAVPVQNQYHRNAVNKVARAALSRRDVVSSTAFFGAAMALPHGRAVAQDHQSKPIVAHPQPAPAAPAS